MIRWLTRVAILLALVAIDRWSKIFFWTNADATPPIIRGVLEFVHHENHGAIANLPIPQPIIIGATILAMIIITTLLIKAHRRGDSLGALALIFVLAGAIGNLWDRFVQGFVFDWILLFQRSAINAADIFIILGLLTYLITRQKAAPTPTALDGIRKTS